MLDSSITPISEDADEDVAEDADEDAEDEDLMPALVAPQITSLA